jgi:uncharacterized membrane protein YgaE (UPF0421/DUF939 family)
MPRTTEPPQINALIRAAVACALVGLLCVLLFLWRGFTPWSLTVGVMLGFPFLLIAILLYVIAVARDLQQHRLL